MNAALKLKLPFDQGALMTEALRLLETVFGYKSFRSHQERIVETLINGGDALVLMPTGGGKSLCYQIPALVRPGTGIVVSPLIALMQDQVDALKAVGVSAAFLNSSLDRGHARTDRVAVGWGATRYSVRGAGTPGAGADADASGKGQTVTVCHR